MFEIGDVVTLVNRDVIDKGCCIYLGSKAPPLRHIGRVARFEKSSYCNCTLVQLSDGNRGYIDRFRKLPPASPEFISLIRSLSPGKGSEDA